MLKKKENCQFDELTALIKIKISIMFNECAQIAVLLLNENKYIRSDQEKLVKKILYDVFNVHISDESENVMLDLIMQQFIKNYEHTAKLDQTKI